MDKKTKRIILFVVIVVISLIILPNAIKIINEMYLAVVPDSHSQEDYFDELHSVETAVA